MKGFLIFLKNTCFSKSVHINNDNDKNNNDNNKNNNDSNNDNIIDSNNDRNDISNDNNNNKMLIMVIIVKQ